MHFLEGYLTEVDSFPLFGQLTLSYGNMILVFGCDLNNK